MVLYYIISDFGIDSSHYIDFLLMEFKSMGSEHTENLIRTET